MITVMHYIQSVSAAVRRRHLRVSQGKEQTVLGESALSRYSDLPLKAYSQSVSQAALRISLYLR